MAAAVGRANALSGAGVDSSGCGSGCFHPGRAVLAAVGGSVVTRAAAAAAFRVRKRAMTTPDVIGEVGGVFEGLFPCGVLCDGDGGRRQQRLVRLHVVMSRRLILSYCHMTLAGSQQSTTRLVNVPTHLLTHVHLQYTTTT